MLIRCQPTASLPWFVKDTVPLLKFIIPCVDSFYGLYFSREIPYA
jgi:hypothetical protein